MLQLMLTLLMFWKVTRITLDSTFPQLQKEKSSPKKKGP